jgi:hypothetical protein
MTWLLQALYIMFNQRFQYNGYFRQQIHCQHTLFTPTPSQAVSCLAVAVDSHAGGVKG